MLVWLCAVVGMFVITDNAARAQPGTSAEIDQATTHAQTLYRAALSAKRAKEPARALCLMERARAAWPDAAFSFNIAQLQRELGMCAEARQNYQTFLENERDPSRRREAELALAELTQCAAAGSEPASNAAANSCGAWAEAALKPDAENTRSTPDEAARGAAPAASAERKSATPAQSAAVESDTTRAHAARSDAANAEHGNSTGTQDARNKNGRTPLQTARSDAASAGRGSSTGTQDTRGERIPTPAQVASDAHAATAGASSPLVAADAPARRIPVYLPWIFAGAGVLSLGLAGYELTRIAAAERDVENARSWGPEQAAREQDGRTAETLFWVFGGVGTLALAGAVVLALIDGDDPQPSAAATRN